MSKEEVLEHISNIEELAIKEGLDHFPVIFEFIDRDIMLEACSYGLPIRPRYWKHGSAYAHQKASGEMGHSKVYEVVFSSNPSLAYMMNTNTDVVNIMVGAHVFGHSHFTKNNVMFKNQDRNMIHKSAERAFRVDEYIEQYGLDKVEHLMDIGFALNNHIDWHKGIFRDKYPGKKIAKKIRIRGEFEDLTGICKDKKKSVVNVVTGDKLPPHPERDILWFLINYAPLEEWEKDVLDIIRKEAYYFYPIMTTKVLNEGLASFMHAELMNKYDGITDEQFLEFSRVHSSVIQPGNPFNINPYYLGFTILTDIREKWDKLHEEGKSDITGIQKVIEVANSEDDGSFLRNYLTPKLATDLGLFNYGYKIKRDPEMKDKDLKEKHGIVEIKDKELDKIIEHIIRPTLNYGVPLITINEVDGDTLVLSHSDEQGPLDEKYTEKTMEYIFELWGGPIELQTYYHDNEKIVYCFDESGFDSI